MAYSGFLSDPDYTRKSQNETITGKWTFKDTANFEKVIQGTTIASYYADLAEYYECDISDLLPEGTLVKFGGKKEITKTSKNDSHCFGVISSKPGFILNDKETEHHLPVALIGRVPCRVRGLVKKGEELTTSKIPGVATKKTFFDKLIGKPTIGISLENKENKQEKLIEIFVKANI